MARDEDEKPREDEYGDESCDEEDDEIAVGPKAGGQFVYRHACDDKHYGENYQWQILVQDAGSSFGTCYRVVIAEVGKYMRANCGLTGRLTQEELLDMRLRCLGPGRIDYGYCGALLWDVGGKIKGLYVGRAVLEALSTV